jgi:hypothetical protein
MGDSSGELHESDFQLRSRINRLIAHTDEVAPYTSHDDLINLRRDAFELSMKSSNFKEERYEV